MTEVLCPKCSKPLHALPYSTEKICPDCQIFVAFEPEVYQIEIFEGDISVFTQTTNNEYDLMHYLQGWIHPDRYRIVVTGPTTAASCRRENV